MQVTKPVYEAHCSENGERFVSLFQTSETNKSKLMEMGQDLAIGWGGECMSVKPLKTEKKVRMVKMFDQMKNETVELTERRYNAWVKKNPKSTRYDYSKTTYYMEMVKFQDIPDDVWNCDENDAVNLADMPKLVGPQPRK